MEKTGISKIDEFRGFVVAGQFGESNLYLEEHIWSLKWLIQAHMANTRAIGIASIHLLFRVDGKYAVYNCSKAEKVRFSNVHHAVSVDLGVPIFSHQGKTLAQFRHYLCECVEEALNLLIAALKKRKLCQGCELLYDDWMIVKQKFFALPDNPGFDPR